MGPGRHYAKVVIIWDFRLRIADLWNRCALSIIMDRPTQKLTAGRIP
ncbi:hypothetical protein D1AOALGA4SA_4471 [Olavius algarvensis Delta 1 endosymbiont]|nr:hypothetical protein D1AOALGA4SA_4471 [Olavius algarvensis Delta 1 endosymbiont]